MSYTTDGNDSAFSRPSFGYTGGDVEWGAKGLTKREEFAGRAMQGFCADPSRNGKFETYAADAVHAADCLIAALNAEKK